MRYRVAVSMLLLPFAVLPVMNLLAAPAPERAYAILAIGPSPAPTHIWTDEKYRKSQKIAQTDSSFLSRVWKDPEVRKLPLVARFKDPCPWLAKNLQVTEENGGRRLRFTFRDGGRAVQMTILNAVLRANLACRDEAIKDVEEGIRRFHEKNILDLEERIKSDRDPKEAASLQEGIQKLRTEIIPGLRAQIPRYKQTKVIKWAK